MPQMMWRTPSTFAALTLYASLMFIMLIAWWVCCSLGCEARPSIWFLSSKTRAARRETVRTRLKKIHVLGKKRRFWRSFVMHYGKGGIPGAPFPLENPVTFFEICGPPSSGRYPPEFKNSLRMLFVFGPYSGTPKVTMIIARDARAYMNSLTHMRSGDVISYHW